MKNSFDPDYLEILNNLTQLLIDYINNSYSIQLAIEVEDDTQFDVNKFHTVFINDIGNFIGEHLCPSLTTDQIRTLITKSKHELMVEEGIEKGLVRFLGVAFFEFIFLYFVYKNKEFEFNKTLFELMQTDIEYINSLIGFNEKYTGEFLFLKGEKQLGNHKCPFLFFRNKKEILENMVNMSEIIYLTINKKLAQRYARFPEINDDQVLFLMGKLNIK
jgi:hypothetical protein